MFIFKEVVTKLRVRRISGLFWSIFDFFRGGYIRRLILPPRKKSKIGSKEPEIRQNLSFATTSKPKLEVFVRHCHFSDISVHKNRLPGFSRKKCHDNLLKTLPSKGVNVTFLLDTFHPSKETHFVLEQTKYPVIEIKEGTETGSFLQLLSYVESLNLSSKTMIYFLEDDYLHREGWSDVLIEGLSIPEVSYVTLFDHRDKYFHPSYSDLKSRIFHTKSCHWRTTPSTTNTYAMRYETLKQDIAIHRQFSEGRKISADHDKFIKLGEEGRLLISSMPGWATHVEKEYISPCVNWEELFL